MVQAHSAIRFQNTIAFCQPSAAPCKVLIQRQVVGIRIIFDAEIIRGAGHDKINRFIRYLRSHSCDTIPLEKDILKSHSCTPYPQQSQPGRRSLAKSSIFGFIPSPAAYIHARYAPLSCARPFPEPMPVAPARCRNMFATYFLRSARVTG